MRRHNRKHHQLGLRPGRDSSRAHQEDAPSYRSDPVFQFGRDFVRSRGIRVDDHSALRSKEYLARCNKHPIPPLPFLNAPSYAQTVSKPSYDPNIATHHTYVGQFPAADRPNGRDRRDTPTEYASREVRRARRPWREFQCVIWRFGPKTP